MSQETTKVKKRDGRLVSFDQAKVTQAIFKALTITGQGDEKIAKKLSDKVTKVIGRRFKKADIPEVEQIQDIIEEVLMLEDLVETARSYILYREKRRNIREADQIYDEAVEILDRYIDEMDWEVKENSNMAYSLQGLNNYGVSTLTRRYWLNKIYPKQIRDGITSGDFHVHDLDVLGVYCCGWDLYDLLKRGFSGVPGKVESKPPKHLRAALGQVVNFFYTVQGEIAGAIAFSNFDTLLAPFIRYDNMEYKEVKQAMQEFLFNCAVPTRVGFQCMSEDTEILTAEGWKGHNGIKQGDIIKTFNVNTVRIEDKKVQRIFKKEYDGLMYNIIGEKQDQLISPGHRVVIKSGDNFYSFKTIEEVLKLDSSIFIPVVFEKEEIKTEEILIETIKKVDYKGIIWCPTTENETVIARRNGKVFITGNTPFSNITLDIKPSVSYAKQPIIIGGELQKETYGEFQEEMNMINKAFYEVMMEGDKNGRIFTFPIPTINITEDFPWDDPIVEPMWQATAKYGLNYFANFIQSDMKPEDARSMCMDGKEEILIKNSNKIKRLSIKEVAEQYKQDEFDQEGWAECEKTRNLQVLSLNPKTFKLEWSSVERFLKIKDNQEITITTEDGKDAVFSVKHPMAVYTPQGIQMKFAKDITLGDYLLTLKAGNKDVLSSYYQKIDGNIVLDDDLAKFLGYFTADGNYLFESRKGYTHYGEPRGIQFTFHSQELQNLDLIKTLTKKVFGIVGKEKQDPRYNTYYFYIYNTELARKLYKAGFKKYGRVPQVLFNSPPSVIKAFLEFHFKGDGYEKRKEIHMNDLELSRDLVLLYSLVGQPVTYKLRKNSQVIRLQFSNSKVKKGNDRLNNPILSERVPGWAACSTYKVPGLHKTRMVGFDVLDKYSAHTEESLRLKDADIYLTRVTETVIKKYKKPKVFYDLELTKNHLFVHSLGQISFNCCRLRLDNRELLKRGGGLFGANPLTGSIGVVTINLPRLGYLSKTKKEFFQRLDRVMDLSKESLEIKRKAIEDFIRKGLYPYSRFYLDGVEKIRGSYYGNHFSTIGLLGMNECMLNFTGEDITSEGGQKLSLEIMDHMRERITSYQIETDNLYNLEATPAEGASYKLCLKDKDKYPDIITAGTKEVPYYTNSTQLPVGYTDDIFEALELQDELQCKYTGGTVVHLFLGEKIKNIDSIKVLIKKIFSQFKLPYITFTPTFSICPTHGYLAGEHWECPKCTIEQKCEVYSRVVGYIRPVQQWHDGKTQEFKDRKTFKMNP